MRQNSVNIIRHSCRTLLLVIHVILTVLLFYEMITNKKNYDKYEVLFNKIQSGFVAIVSLISFGAYVWRFSTIESTSTKLNEIDRSMKSIGIKLQSNGNYFSNAIEFCAYLIVITVYYYSRFLRYRYLAKHKFLTSLWFSFVRCYYVVLNEIVVISFIKLLRRGRRRLILLNRHVINQVVEKFATWMPSNAARKLYSYFTYR